MNKRRDIPNPAYWAITEKNGAQLIEPGTPLYEQVIGSLGNAATHEVVELGDILEASEQSRILTPESLGIDRQTIVGYKPEQDQ